MAYSARVIADSIAPSGSRLSTLEVVFPRIVLAEMNTHRMLSRNSASSRAIPIKTMINRVVEDPFIPVWWGKNQKGMQASVELTEKERERALVEWLVARDSAVESVSRLQDLDVHKQIANRLLEPWLWQTALISATTWENFMALRLARDAQPEIRKAAELMNAALRASKPRELDYGEWHLPLHNPELDLDCSVEDLPYICAGRCARVSYLTHEGLRDPSKDLDLAKNLAKSGHMSPFEHVARATSDSLFDSTGNFSASWLQLRKMMPNEAVFIKRDVQ